MSITTQNQRNRDQQYGIKSSRSQQTLSADPASCKTDSTGTGHKLALIQEFYGNVQIVLFWKIHIESL